MSLLIENVSSTVRQTAWASAGQCVILHDVSWKKSAIAHYFDLTKPYAQWFTTATRFNTQ